MSAPGNRYEERKLAGLCTRCGEPATEDGQLCAVHQADYVRRKQRFNRGTRRARELDGKCRDCGEKATIGVYCAAHAIRREISSVGRWNNVGNIIARARAVLVDAEPASNGNNVGNHSEDGVDLALAVRSIVQTLDALVVARAAPASQRRLAELAALSGVEVAIQLGEEVLDRNGYVRARRGERPVHRDIKPANVISPRRATCAICGVRDATTEHAHEGRVVAACELCAADVEVPDPPKGPQLRDRILAMLRRSDGMEVGEIAQALGEDDAMSRGRISASLARAIKDGEVSCTGGQMSRTYHWVKR